MVKNKLIISCFFILIILFLIFYISNYQPLSEDYIRKEIEKANYCNLKEDCVFAGSKCPFGCNIFVNKNEKEKISDLIDNYQTTCMYACVELKDYDCIDNKCESVY